jgi:hypothetical protein
MEEPGWNPTTGTFFVFHSQSADNPTNPNAPGGVSEISTAGQSLRTIDFATLGISSCSPTGLAVGGGGNMMVGCSNVGTQAVLLNSQGHWPLAARTQQATVGFFNAKAPDTGCNARSSDY